MKTLSTILCLGVFLGKLLGAQIIIVRRAPVAGASYTGVGDIQTSGVLAAHGLRAFSAATRGTNAVEVCNAMDAACANLATNASTGALTVTTIGGTDCDMATCTVKTLYDQSGGGFHLVQATEALRPVFDPTCAEANNLPCLRWTGPLRLESAGSVSSTNQPYSAGVVANRTTTVSYATIISNEITVAASAAIVGFVSTANTVYGYSGMLVSRAAADAATHSIQVMFNGASSKIDVDGSTGTGDMGNPAISNQFCMGNCDGAVGLVGITTEDYWFSGDISANFSAISTNQHTYWGY